LRSPLIVLFEPGASAGGEFLKLGLGQVAVRADEAKKEIRVRPVSTPALRSLSLAL
jgi:hypothetical protein